MHPAFEVHRLNEEGMNNAKRIATLFNDLLADLENIIPDGGREMKIVTTKLEEACFFAKKAMANETENQA